MLQYVDSDPRMAGAAVPGEGSPATDPRGSNKESLTRVVTVASNIFNQGMYGGSLGKKSLLIAKEN